MNMVIKDNIIEKAKDVAKSSNVKRGKVGAVLFTRKGRIISFASNTKIYGDSKKFTIHAEEMLVAKALRLKALNRYDDLNILVVRYRLKDNNISIAKPCEKCQEILKETGIPVYFSDVHGIINRLEY